MEDKNLNLTKIFTKKEKQMKKRCLVIKGYLNIF